MVRILERYQMGVERLAELCIDDWSMTTNTQACDVHYTFYASISPASGERIHIGLRRSPIFRSDARLYCSRMTHENRPYGYDIEPYKHRYLFDLRFART
eukprot:1179871-Prorocentrum_minimum.AAC.5